MDHRMGHRVGVWLALGRVALVCGAVSGCTPGGRAEGGAVGLLRAHFPRHVDRVLGAASDGAGAAADPRRGIRATFPPRGDGAVRMTLPDGLTLDVRELGLHAEARIERGAHVYDRGDGEGSFWSAAGRGWEEWLLTRPAADGAVAAWEVRGGSLRQRGATVEVVDGAGLARIVITAPRAYAAGGEVKVALVVEHGRLLLRVVDPGALPAQALVLADPLWTAAGGMVYARVEHTATLLPSGRVLVTGGLGVTLSYLTAAETYDPGTDTWTEAGDMAIGRVDHTASLLRSGKVLVVGGNSHGQHPTATELYDPATDRWTNAAPLASGRELHTATLMMSGKLLAVGGWGDNVLLKAAEAYDPAGDAWTAAGAMATGRVYCTATLLPSGKVLVAGGEDENHNLLKSAELYDPASNTWTAAAPLATARAYQTATLLASGRVLVAGGTGNSGPLVSAELYDPAINTWARAADMATAHGSTATLLPSGDVLVSDVGGAELYHPGSNTWTTASPPALPDGHTATLLPSGQVLLAGGTGASNLTNAAELYDPTAGAWTAAGGGGAAGTHHAATLLTSGKVLVTGGLMEAVGWSVGSAELYDPGSATWTVAADMSTGRAWHTATLLASGKVLVAGGSGGNVASTSAEIYEPASDTWTAAGALALARYQHTATLLQSGNVLVTGGFGAGGGSINRAEAYDPGSNAWTAAGVLTSARESHTATLLPSGKVLVAGGEYLPGTLVSSAELYDPGSGTWTAAGVLATARKWHTATLLPSGKVLVAGGLGNSDHLRSAELYDPLSNAWAAAGALASGRNRHAATLLPSGKVLVVGGDGDSGVLASAELYDPGSDTWTAAGALADASESPTATLLASGQVLVAGGDNGTTTVGSAELYDEGRGAQPAWTPTLAGPSTVAPGSPLALTGTLFTGVSAASSGTTSSSDTNFPLLLVIRIDNQQLAYAPTSDWTATSATAAIPATLPHGPYLAWAVVNGVLSNGAAQLVAELPLGAPCSAGTACASLHCVDGVCCDSACAGVCEHCGVTGACSAIPAGTDPDAECPGTGACRGTCDGARACAYPGTGHVCALCTGCNSTGSCAVPAGDDPACGAIPCSTLSTTCRTYADRTADRCAAVGACIHPDPTTCTAYTDAPDGTSCTCGGGATETCLSGVCPCPLPDGGQTDASEVDAGLTGDGGGADAVTPPDGGGVDAVTPPDGGGADAATTPDGATPSDAHQSADALHGHVVARGCGCRTSGGLVPTELLPLALGLVLVRCRRRRALRSAGTPATESSKAGFPVPPDAAGHCRSASSRRRLRRRTRRPRAGTRRSLTTSTPEVGLRASAGPASRTPGHPPATPGQEDRTTRAGEPARGRRGRGGGQRPGGSAGSSCCGATAGDGLVTVRPPR